MIVKLIRLLHLLGVDALLLGLFEKWMLWAIKALESLLKIAQKWNNWVFDTLSVLIKAMQNALVQTAITHKDALS